MNPQDPESAQRIVTEYGQLLETGARQDLPESVGMLPYPKQTIKAAILTCVATLRATDQLTVDMRDFLEEAYVALADYVDEDIVRLMAEYRRALASVAEIQAARDKMQTTGWQQITETSRLAGDIAKSIADDVAALRLEFQRALGTPLRP